MWRLYYKRTKCSHYREYVTREPGLNVTNVKNVTRGPRGLGLNVTNVEYMLRELGLNVNVENMLQED